MEKITLCGDNCCKCPRYLAKTNGELEKVAELWFRIGWRDRIVPIEEIRCAGCTSHKQCTYCLVDCVKENHVEKCNQCPRFPCEKITDLLRRSEKYEEKCKAVCTDEEYRMLKSAFSDEPIRTNPSDPMPVWRALHLIACFSGFSRG